MYMHAGWSFGKYWLGAYMDIRIKVNKTVFSSCAQHLYFLPIHRSSRTCFICCCQGPWYSATNIKINKFVSKESFSLDYGNVGNWSIIGKCKKRTKVAKIFMNFFIVIIAAFHESCSWTIIYIFVMNIITNSLKKQRINVYFYY